MSSSSDLDTRLQTALLERGLEDWIPVPEAVRLPEVRAIGGDPAVALARALRDLLRAEKIRIYRGRWDDNDPERVPDEDAARLLADPAWFSFHLDDPEEQRLTFVNVQNIRPEYR